MSRPIGTLLVLLACLGCGTGRRTFEEPVTLGGVEVAPGVLNDGEFVYMSRCRGCHGVAGRGDGPYAASLTPRPSDLTAGVYPRIADDGDLPDDDALRRVLREGIAGTAMGPQDLGPEQLEPVLQYVKTLAPRAWVDQRVQ